MDTSLLWKVYKTYNFIRKIERFNKWSLKNYKRSRAFPEDLLEINPVNIPHVDIKSGASNNK